MKFLLVAVASTILLSSCAFFQSDDEEEPKTTEIVMNRDNFINFSINCLNNIEKAQANYESVYYDAQACLSTVYRLTVTEVKIKERISEKKTHRLEKTVYKDN